MPGQTSPMDPSTSSSNAVAKGDVQATRKLFETRPLDRLGSRPSLQDPSPLELRAELQELRGDVKTTVALFQTQPLCALRDAGGAMHEVRAACREEIRSHAVRAARWLFETRPLDAFHEDPGRVRVIRGISLEEGAGPDVSAMQWVFETQPLDAIREVVVDERHFQASPDLILDGPGVRRQRQLFETRPLDTLRGEENEGEESEMEAHPPPKEAVPPGHVRSTLWLFETTPLDGFTPQVQMGELQKVGGQGGEGSPAPDAPQEDTLKGDVKAFQHLFETLPLDKIGGQDEFSSIPGNITRAGTRETASRSSQDPSNPVYAMQDGRGRLYALTSVSREQVLGGDGRSYRWMFETRPLDQLGGSPDKVDVVRGITRQVRIGDVATAQWLFETQPLATIHAQAQQEEREGAPPDTVPTIRWLFETRPVGASLATQGSETSCTWLFQPGTQDPVDSGGEQHLQADLVEGGHGQTDRHVFDTEPLQASCRPGLVRSWSRVHIPSGQVCRHQEICQSPEKEEEAESSRTHPDPGLTPPTCKFTWLFEQGEVTSSGQNLPEGPKGETRGAKDPLEVLGSGGVLVEAPDLQGALQNLREAVAEVKGLRQHALDRHHPQRTPAVPATHTHNGLPHTPATTPGVRPGAEGDPEIPEVSGGPDLPPRGSVQDGVYTAHPVRTEGPCGVGPSPPEPQTAGPHLQPCDQASVPPLSAHPAATTRPWPALPGGHGGDAIRRNAVGPHNPLLQTPSEPPAGRSHPGGVQMDTPKADAARPPRKKPPVPPKPAHLANIPPPSSRPHSQSPAQTTAPLDGDGREF
ncbi:PREDICTED: xin actin-binding repeat-containing protein 1 [Dipodomys ordii]|uniref:Xin actin-binding repeat-containing protein 1 n=1 Tax=Dipodomys ordii TaxID=10020 RepID=A0A1S3GA52_DIPOR|nr:PREDICTED: xin actin-binding repeat-containing protein 1 [Dipodomys ordii]